MSANDTTATFTVELRDAVSPSSKSAAEALAALKKAVLGGTEELRGMQAAMARLKAGGLTGSKTFQDLRDRADALKKSIGASQEKFLQLGGTLGDLKPAQAKEGWQELLGVMTRLPGPLGPASSKLLGLSGASSVALLGVAGLALGALALVTALATVISTITEAAIALTRFGLASADARRNELLHLEGVVSLRSEFSRAAGSATALQAAIDRISSSSALSRTRVADYAEQLHRAGLRGALLEDALRGITTVAAVQGDTAATRFRAMAIAAARTRGSVRSLTDDVQRRLGGTARRMSLSWDRQMERLRESWAGLFSGLRLDGALEALDRVLSLFSATTTTGRALRLVLTTIFQPFLDSVAQADSPVREFFEGALLGALRLGNGVLRLRNALAGAFGAPARELAGFVNWSMVGLIAVAGLGVVVLSVVAVFAALGLAIGVVAYGFYSMWQNLRETWASLVKLRSVLAVLDWGAVGRSLIDGLVTGLTSGAQRAWKAVTTIGEGMTTALRTALDIQSPSRVFAELGRMIPRGLAMGVEAEAGVSTSAIEGLGEASPGGAVARERGGDRGGDVYVSIDGIQIVVGSAEEVPTDLAARVREVLEQALLGVLVETGGSRA